MASPSAAPSISAPPTAQPRTHLLRRRQTLGGTGSIVLGGTLGNTINTASSGGDSGTLTIGPGITIDGNSGSIGYDPNGTRRL